VPLAMTGLTGCFATQADIRVLQSDLVLIRNEQAAADSAQRVQIEQVIQALGDVRDSISVVNTRVARFRGDMTGSVTSIEQQLLQIQELTGQSQRRLQEVRESLEARQQTQMPVPVTTPEGDTTSAPVAAMPGPNELFRVAHEQMMQGSNSAARTAFEDLLTKYPKADVAADAQFYIAETYAAEGTTDAADSVYALVAKKYPKSAKAPTALYKRALIAATAGETSQAKKLLNQVIKSYPRSDEASLAKDRIKTLE
jgi:tol-pal system protein YbgF